MFGLLRHWVLVHPQSIGKKQLPVSIIFEAADLDTVKRAAIDRELNELSYKKLKDWFVYLESLVKLGCPSEDEIKRLAEIKATRDVFIHNSGVANAIYEEKAGEKKRFRAGEKMDVPETTIVRLGTDQEGRYRRLGGGYREGVGDCVVREKWTMFRALGVSQSKLTMSAHTSRGLPFR